MLTHCYEDSTRPVEVVDPALREEREEMYDQHFGVNKEMIATEKQRTAKRFVPTSSQSLPSHPLINKNYLFYLFISASYLIRVKVEGSVEVQHTSS